MPSSICYIYVFKANQMMVGLNQFKSKYQIKLAILHGPHINESSSDVI